MLFDRFRKAKADVSLMNLVLPAAERLAHNDGRQLAAEDDLLLAALDLPDGMARNVLATLGLDEFVLRNAIADQTREALASVGVNADHNAIAATLPPAPSAGRGVFRSEASAQALFQRAVQLAKDARSPMSSAHFLLAATEQAHGTLARTFAALGIDRKGLADLTRQELAQRR